MMLIRMDNRTGMGIERLVREWDGKMASDEPS